MKKIKIVLALSIGMIVGSASTVLSATNDTVQATITKFVFKVNGNQKELQNSPLVVDGTVYLPI